LDTYRRDAGIKVPESSISEASSPETLRLFRKAEDIDWLLGIPGVGQRETEADDMDEVNDIDCGEPEPSDDERQFYAPSCLYRTLPSNYPRARVTLQGNLTELSDGYVFTLGPEPGGQKPVFHIIMTARGDPVYYDRSSDHLEPTHNGQLTRW